MRAGLIAGVAAAVLAACGPPRAPAHAEGPGGTPAISIRASAVTLRPGTLNGLQLLSAVSLTSSHPDFGGFSGLVVTDGHMVAVSDRGAWLLADLAEDAPGLRPVRAGMAPMLGSDGRALDKAGGDAEGLTIRDGNLVVSFERDHRISFHQERGQLGDVVRDRIFERMSSNKGMEALATTPDGWILGIGERPLERGFPVHLLRYSGEILRGWLPASSRHFVTGADVGPDGNLYVLKRDFSILLGLSILIERYALDSDGFPDSASRTLLARMDGQSRIGNMEGISLWQDQAGRTRLTLVSDDNFNGLLRTLLVDFEVLDAPVQ